MAGTGSRLGVLAFSKEQEREADRLALLLLWRARSQAEAARGFLITMSRASTRRETGLFDSHPAGPERLAAFDATLAELRATGAIPLRAG
jgi:predicted Zn-dependent protease